MAQRYIVKSSVSHGQARGEKKQVWNMSKGQTFDPSEMDMNKATVDRLISSKYIAVHDGGEGTVARPVASPLGTTVTTGRQEGQGPDPKSSVGVRQEGGKSA